jgi:putative restriction endonuclease
MGGLGIRPDLIVQVRQDILNEDDGPMLIHGLKACHGAPLMVRPRVPHDRPDKELLEARYQDFLQHA